MRLHDRARSTLAERLPSGETVRAAVSLSHLGAGWASSGGVVHGGPSLLGSDYARHHGIDLTDPTLRSPLLQSWCALTSTRLVFFAPSNTSIRPTPGDQIDSVELAGTTLHWFDVKDMSMTRRVLHLRFADGTQLLSATPYQSRLRRRPINDEPDAFVEAFGAAATQIAAG